MADAHDSRDLAKAAQPIMAEAREALSHSGTIMVLADSRATVLEVQGDDAARSAAAEMGLTIGVDWSERVRGTNAIGTALHTGEPVHVHGPEHYCQGSTQWTCAGAAVRDAAADRSLHGAVSVAGLSDTYNPHLLPLTLAIAARIQSTLAIRENRRRERLLEVGLGRLSAVASGGLLLFDRRGRFVTSDARGGLVLAAMGLAPNREVYTRIDALDVSTAAEEREVSLPYWMEPEWLEPIVDGNERIGTLIVLPHASQRALKVTRDGLPSYKLRRATEFIDAHLREAIHLEQVAAAAQVSPYHFHRQFKKATGMTPHQFIVSRRIEVAKRLLTASDLPIIEVAAQAGFMDQSHFTTTFRKLTSMTPRNYRHAMLG